MNRREFMKTAVSAAACLPLTRFNAAADNLPAEMTYRNLGATGLSVGTIALGVEGFKTDSLPRTKEMIDFAARNGVNFIDVCLSDPELLSNLSRAMGNGRNRFIIQGHICSVWENGQYRRTRNFAAAEKAFERMSEAFGGRIEIGMIHYVDDENDFDAVFNGKIIEYVKELKSSGKITAAGLSTHNPEIGKKAAQSGLIDVIMFSINPGYDLSPDGNRIVYNRERQDFYELCARKNIGLDVMKPYGGGNLLNADLSPFGKAFTPVQALNYALTRPAVAAVMVGCRSVEEMRAALAWNGATAAEKDYTVAFEGLDAKSWNGHCLYCGHCAPCPKEINIADVNKYLNLALAQNSVPPTVRSHYELLSRHASDCIQCGVCETRCPFQVAVRDKMKQAAAVFGM